MLKAMTERAKEISEGYLETSDGESYLRIPGGRVVRHSNGRFLLVERDFEDIPSGSIGDFIKSNFGNFLLTNLRSSFPDLARVAKDKILAFDLETLGFKYSDPIIAAGFTRLSRRSFQSGVLFARDYSEEGPMLDYLLGMLNDQDVVITYNGSSFDFPRLQERAKLNGIFLNGFSPISFCGQSKKKHIDLYPLVRQRFKSANNRLQHLEKLMFDYERPDDIPSKEIPDVYREHVMKGNHNRMLEKVIDHCMMDTVTLMGVLGKLSKR